MTKMRGNVFRNAFIRVEETPNPKFLKFLPVGKIFLESGSHDFSSAKEALSSPMVKRIFSAEGIAKVFVGKDYISIGKSDDSKWEEIKMHVIDSINHHFTKELPLFDEDFILNSPNSIKDEDTLVVQEIKEILETRIRPFVQEDGGDIAFHSFDEDEGLLLLELQGSCDGCPSSEVTLKSGIQNMLAHYIPEVKTVSAIQPVTE